MTVKTAATTVIQTTCMDAGLLAMRTGGENCKELLAKSGSVLLRQGSFSVTCVLTDMPAWAIKQTLENRYDHLVVVAVLEQGE